MGPNVGQPINLADCNDWNQANTEQRLGTIQELKGFAGGPVVGNNGNSPSGTGAVLDDKQAYDLFQNYCKESFTRRLQALQAVRARGSLRGPPPAIAPRVDSAALRV